MISSLFVIIAIWSVMFFCFLIISKIFDQKHVYIYPSLLPAAFISLVASILGFIAGVFLIFLFSFLFKSDLEYQGFGYFMSAIATGLFLLWRSEEKKPRHNQKQFVELSENLSLAEIKKTIGERFPNTKLSHIGIFSGFPDKQDVLRFLPYDFSHFIEHGDSFETKVYYPHSLGLAIKVAETKDSEMKKSKLFFSNGELYVSVEKI